MGTTIVVPIKTSRDREFLGDPWGDFAEIFRVDRGHAYLQTTPRLFSRRSKFYRPILIRSFVAKIVEKVVDYYGHHDSGTNAFVGTKRGVVLPVFGS